MSVSIQFVRGSLAGRRFQVGPDGLLVGRSHACSARPTETDVSGKHLSLADENGTLSVTVLSAHRTTADGAPVKQGTVFPARPGTTVGLGDSLAFRVSGDMPGEDGETETLPDGATETLSGATGTLTAATRVAGTADDEETGTFTAATRVAGTADDGETGTFTAATRVGGMTDGGETAILDASGFAKGGSDADDSSGGETQVLQTQVASFEELAAMRTMFREKKKNKLVVRMAAFAAVFGLVLGLSAWMASKKPEVSIVRKPGSGPWCRKELYRATDGAPVPGTFGVGWPTNAGPASVRTPRPERIEAVATIGRDGDVSLWVSAERYEDPAALSETREESFRRYLETSKDFASALDGMIEMPEGDFFGGSGGLHHGVPCSRREYWRDRPDGESVWGVVSFFRSGTLCCAVWREVVSTERERTKGFLEPTNGFAWANPGFADAQWEGAPDAKCDDPGTELVRCSERLAVDSPVEWPSLEIRLRNVLAAASAAGGASNVRGAALSELVKLRGRKAFAWRQYATKRSSLADFSGRDENADAKRLDALVRKTFSDPTEEWGVLAMRRTWWK